MITTKMKPKYKLLLTGIFILLLLIGGFAWYLFTEKFADTAEKRSDYTVYAIDFIKEFQKNDSLANNKYVEKIISVKGIVTDLETLDSTVNIKMSDTLTGDYIIYTFQEQHLAEAKKIKIGKEVSIKGSCSGGTYSDILQTRYISFKRAVLIK